MKERLAVCLHLVHPSRRIAQHLCSAKFLSPLTKSSSSSRPLESEGSLFKVSTRATLRASFFISLCIIHHRESRSSYNSLFVCIVFIVVCFVRDVQATRWCHLFDRFYNDGVFYITCFITSHRYDFVISNIRR